MERLRAGDASALADLYDRHAPLMLALAKRVLGDEREASDLLHDVFLEAWEQAHDYEPERGTVRTWLLIRTRSRALDRKHSARIARRSDPPPGEQASHAHHALTPERLSVRAALEQLPQEARQALELSYFVGMTGAEIARHLDIPEGTVRSRLARGLTLLEELLSATGTAKP